MKYFLSQPLPAEHVPEAAMKSIIELHGSYEAFNEKVAAVSNLPEQIEAFERCLKDDELEWLSAFNVTLFSGKSQQELISGVEVPFQPKEVGAVASKINGVSFIAVDVDMLIENPLNWTDEQLHGYLAHVLTHECTHLQQMIRGDLDMTPTALYWKGVEYPMKAMQDEVAALREMYKDPMVFQYHLVEQQVQFPWELEAYGRALELLDLDTAYPDPKWNELMRRIQNNFREIYTAEGRNAVVR